LNYITRDSFIEEKNNKTLEGNQICGIARDDLGKTKFKKQGKFESRS
jgi:hypothetical protein